MDNELLRYYDKIDDLAENKYFFPKKNAIHNTQINVLGRRGYNSSKDKENFVVSIVE